MGFICRFQRSSCRLGDGCGRRDDGEQRRSSVGRIDDPPRSFRIVVVVGVEIAVLQTVVVVVIIIIVFNHRFFALFLHVGRGCRR